MKTSLANIYIQKERMPMSKALIICVAGMSSSLMAQKTTEFFKNQGKDITVEAISSNEGERVITDATYDLYLVSPQATMYYNQFAIAGEKSGRPVVKVPPQAYVPIPMGVEKMANLILESI